MVSWDVAGNNRRGSRRGQGPAIRRVTSAAGQTRQNAHWAQHGQANRCQASTSAKPGLVDPNHTAESLVV